MLNLQPRAKHAACGVSAGGLTCPTCGEVAPIFRSGGRRHIATDMRVPFLCPIPLDPQIAAACDSGQAFVRRYAAAPTAALMHTIIQPIAALFATPLTSETATSQRPPS
jgi:hypothetical protein